MSSSASGNGGGCGGGTHPRSPTNPLRLIPIGAIAAVSLCAGILIGREERIVVDRCHNYHRGGGGGGGTAIPSCSTSENVPSSIAAAPSLGVGVVSSTPPLSVGNASTTKKSSSGGRIPIHIVQYGKPRTATTLQFQIVCVSLFLKLLNGGPEPTLVNRSEAKLSSMNCGNQKFITSKFKAREPKVIKTHGILPQGHSSLFDSGEEGMMWLFTTARNRKEAMRTRAEMERRGYNVAYVQDLETVAEKGHHIAIDYANMFGLNRTEREDLLEYIRYWDVLRICCGRQMSKAWRNELLLGADGMRNSLANYPTSHACSMYDIDRVEELFRGTAIYRELMKYRGLEKMNRPSVVDGNLNGTYCSMYNELVRTTGLGFNEGPTQR